MMIDYDATNFLVTKNQKYFSEEYEISTTNHDFQLAFAFVNYNNPNESIQDEADYGETKAFYKIWGDSDTPEVRYEEIKTRPCTKAELQLDELTTSTKFWPYHQTALPDIDRFSKKFQCFDENLKVFGTYNSMKAQNLAIQYTKCDVTKRLTCKTEEQINAFMRQKFILTLQNEQRFDLDEYKHDKKIVKESVLKYHPLSSQVR